jgi:hypothetical protein
MTDLLTASKFNRMCMLNEANAENSSLRAFSSGGSCRIMRSLHNVHEMNAYRADHVCLSSWFNSRTAGRIWIKFGTDIKPLSYTLKSYFSVSKNR